MLLLFMRVRLDHPVGKMQGSSNALVNIRGRPGTVWDVFAPIEASVGPRRSEIHSRGC